MEHYDALCQDASTAAEMRLLDHFKQHGGEVWTIGAGCEGCRQKLEDVSVLKKCSSCEVALFCGRECQVKTWRAHKAACGVLTTFQRAQKGDSSESPIAQLKALLETLSWSTTTKTDVEPTAMGIATSLGMNSEKLPGWFCTVDFEVESKERQKSLYQAALELYALLRDEESWARDKDSFPRSSYTLVESLPKAFSQSEQLQKDFVALNGHLLLFSTWLQHPEPPATQSVPLEDRSFFGIVDSLLQISTIRGGVDAFMDSKAS